jgi:hypothetical protein
MGNPSKSRETIPVRDPHSLSAWFAGMSANNYFLTSSVAEYFVSLGNMPGSDATLLIMHLRGKELPPRNLLLPLAICSHYICYSLLRVIYSRWYTVHHCKSNSFSIRFTKSLFTIASSYEISQLLMISCEGGGMVHRRLLAVWTHTRQSADLYIGIVNSGKERPIIFEIYWLSIGFQVYVLDLLVNSASGRYRWRSEPKYL